MATIILTAVGTALGGPLGAALGALAGSAIDGAVFGGRKTQGPRLKELAVQTSSYGSAMPLLFGRMRVAGTVIWSTELAEHKDSSGGGKGRPSTTSYTYSASFAVALASRPIASIGRVWADGNLLRGAAGDLKSGGTMRVHTGYGDQAADALMAQAEGAARCPAHRHCAYVVFEDLQLADFGNRLPSLTFEVFADAGDTSVGAIVRAILPEAGVENLGAGFAGFSVDQGSVGDTLAAIGEAMPLACASDGTNLVVRLADAGFPAEIALLPNPARSDDVQADKAKLEGWSRRREPMPRTRQCGLRYYDIARDYQPGLQRGIGRSGQGELTTIELPAALTADAARAIASAAGRRASRASDTISYRITEVDPALVPGRFVHLPVASGLWRIVQWEWQKDGVLLELAACSARDASAVPAAPATDAGRFNAPVDLLPTVTVLCAFELPWDGNGSSNSPALYAAASGASAGWTGAALFTEMAGSGGSLVPLGSTGRRRASTGRTLGILGTGSPMLVDTDSSLDVELTGHDLTLASANLGALLQGANQALVGAEIVQFAGAEPLGDGCWRLSDLLRGRGGTEWAIAGHAAGEPFALLDTALTRLDPALVGESASARIIAVGLGDAEAVSVPVMQAGVTQRPLSPVHGTAVRAADGGLALSWVRRARGGWLWLDTVDVPLAEESEAWEITYGDAASPSVRWESGTSLLMLTSAQVAGLDEVEPHRFHIRQVGRNAASVALTIDLPV